jgi:hypothetical protein
MDPATPDLISTIGSGVSTALIQMVSAMLTPAIGFLAVPTFILTQAIKMLLTHFRRAPSGELIWFVIAPLSGCVSALAIWKEPIPHWLAAAAAASLLANIIYALAFKRLIGTLSPDGYERMNIIQQRRKKDKGPPKGQDDRRE